MEYEFVHDAITGSATARFSMEHQIMGPWLEVELGANKDKLKTLFDVIENEGRRQQEDVVISGLEYTLIFTEDSVKVIPNIDLDEGIRANDDAIEEGLNSDFDSASECGIEDFKTLLIDWSNFI